MNTIDFKTPDRFLELSDCALPYWRIGQGPDLVFAHGWPLDARTWRHIAPRLAQRFTCHLIDLPGAGQSRWDARTAIGLQENGQTLGAAIAALGLEHYALVGHDSGAMFTRLHAAAAPERVWGLVIGNSEIPGHVPWQLKLLIATMRLPGGRGALRLVMRSRWGRGSAIGLGGCFEDMAVAEGEFHELFIRPLVESNAVYAGHARLAHNLDVRVLENLPRTHAAIQAPVQLLWGSDDPWFPLEKARAMIPQFGGAAELEVLTPGKLFVHEERPAIWADTALRFLEAHSPRRTVARAAG